MQIMERNSTVKPLKTKTPDERAMGAADEIERERESERERAREREGIVLECCGEEGATCQRIHFSGLHLWSRALGNGLRNQNVYQCPSQGGQA